MIKSGRIALLSLALTLADASAAQAADEPRVFAPTSEWSVGTDGESCYVIRQFGGADDGVTLALQSFSPGGAWYSVTLRGDPLPHRDSGILEFETRFNPDTEATPRMGLLSSGREIPRLTFPASLERASDVKARSEGAPLPTSIDAEREASVDEFVVAFSRGQPLSLQIGPMTRPLALLRECTAGLIEKWGLDPAVQRSLSRPVKPLDQGKWLSPGTYPWEYLRTYRSAAVYVRLMTDEKGAASQCFVQSPSGQTQVGFLACRELMKTARFEPALDQAGNPVASYFTYSVFYRTRRRNGNW